MKEKRAFGEAGKKVPSGAIEVFADDVDFAISASGDGGPGGCPCPGSSISASGDGGPGGCPYLGSGGIPPLGEVEQK